MELCPCGVLTHLWICGSGASVGTLRCYFKPNCLLILRIDCNDAVDFCDPEEQIAQRFEKQRKKVSQCSDEFDLAKCASQSVKEDP